VRKTAFDYDGGNQRPPERNSSDVGIEAILRQAGLDGPILPNMQLLEVCELGVN